MTGGVSTQSSKDAHNATGSLRQRFKDPPAGETLEGFLSSTIRQFYTPKAGVFPVPTHRGVLNPSTPSYPNPPSP